MAVDKETLLKRAFTEEDFDIDGIGTVRIRALSRAEVLTLKDKTLEVAEAEQRLLSLAVVEPKLTEDDVRMWQENTPAWALNPLVNRISELSGLTKAAAKEAMLDFRG